MRKSTAMPIRADVTKTVSVSEFLEQLPEENTDKPLKVSFNGTVHGVIDVIDTKNGSVFLTSEDEKGVLYNLLDTSDVVSPLLAEFESEIFEVKDVTLNPEEILLNLDTKAISFAGRRNSISALVNSI